MKLFSAGTPCRCRFLGTKTGLYKTKGRYYRRSDSRWIRRWKCLLCRSSFSNATFHPCYRQKKRTVNEPLFRLLCSGVSLRRSAKLLFLSRRTVERKFQFLAEQARLNQKSFLTSEIPDKSLNEVYFDEMETFEHSKLKPVSIALAVSHDRKILGAFVASMPATGLLAAKSVDKYGKREDRRASALSGLFRSIKRLVAEDAILKSDKNPRYPLRVERHFPNATHVTTKGDRSCVVGQGELKANSRDPLFKFNHSAAMVRANLNRMFRKTWCTTKTLQGLKNHLALYLDFHNQLLVQ